MPENNGVNFGGENLTVFIREEEPTLNEIIPKLSSTQLKRIKHRALNGSRDEKRDYFILKIQSAKNRSIIRKCIHNLCKISLSGDPIAAHYLVNYYDAIKEYGSAFRWCKHAADLGHLDALCDLGYKYQYGEGCELDYSKALEFTSMSAEAGNTQAIHNLAVMYDEGVIVDKDVDRAVLLYRNASRKGHPVSKYNLAMTIQSNPERFGSPEEAFSLYSESAQKNYKLAIRAVAYCYTAGYGVSVDHKKALDWTKKRDRRGICKLYHGLGALSLFWSIGRKK
ncbi:tetratricopeptide repeat protein [Gallaecimonas kandeliae]|uniref:tetratricopeptide repeat protein n=1 Tax=Gallaecimonas kandeliae TaxID=3029055 RepID=UPI002649EE99|nr:tetratricopeptide repeat protein [Gallaecimonas kandeliae]WKE66663.1 tetratricopeptide repeat protein [Gallaecimonas kandeliae]